ncbi:MAG: hypothetical protein A2583_04485 [Bdellovibrionales bacterium RIFOXYD1_FULL_53_11]|nr:MAG: hypothetical protein A2583_04485 [Bdellovibrionales bacterium RIFOXYD1_FULL_53_11]
MIARQANVSLRALIPAVLFALSAPGGVHAYDFPQAAYKETKELTLEILKKYPPSGYFYLGVGRSPAPVLALLKEISPAGAAELPYSAGNRQSVTDALTRRRLDAHFDRFFPAPGKLGNRKILLFDFTETGRGLDAADQELRAYLARRRIAAEVVPLALHSSRDGSADVLKILFGRRGSGVEIIPLKEKYPYLRMVLINTQLKPVAEYASYSPELLDTGALKPSREYAAFREDLRRRLSGDHDFKKRLEEVLGAAGANCRESAGRVLKMPR